MTTVPNPDPEPPLWLKIVSCLLIILLLVLLAVPVLLWILYELLPHRRRRLMTLVGEALSTLARDGESEGKILRNQVVSRTRIDCGYVEFTSIMCMLVRMGDVERRFEREHDDELGEEVTVAFYRITPGGQRRRTKAPSPVEMAGGFLGGLNPAKT
jgi:hypothetical protein